MSSRTEEFGPDLLVDFDAENRPIGIEILAPAQDSAAAINQVILYLGLILPNQVECLPIRRQGPPVGHGVQPL